MSDFSLEVSTTDVQLDYEASRARAEGMNGVAKRQAALALAIRNADVVMANLCPPGYRVRARLVWSFEPDVNIHLSDAARESR